jgi:S-DNA-T family DNA segregation ATPase FtsK/SpoIIIE
MSNLSVQQVLSSRFRTSSEADRLTVELMSGLGLSTKANVARLAIGRSLALGSFADLTIDAKGLEIPAASLFTQDDITIWIGLIVTHARTHGLAPITSMDAFRLAVRNHWHRGATLLMEDWQSSAENFDRFLETLIVRRAELAEGGMESQDINTNNARPEKPEDASSQLVKALAEIGVTGQVKDVIHGPRVTRYKVLLNEVNHLDKLKRGLERLSLSMNIQQSLPILSHGDEARTVNLDIPRPKASWEVVPFAQFRQWVAAQPYDDEKLVVFPGVDVLGRPYSFDLASAPHLLVGGTTGSGKSVCLHSLILSLVLKFTPKLLQLALIDPKQVEFSVYKGSEYLYQGDVATDTPAAKEKIGELVVEMEARYNAFTAAGANNIFEARKNGLLLPYIIVVIEELADLVLQDKEVEPQIVRLAQKARAAGIHLILATQRPDAKTFSGLVRSNIPTLIALTVQRGTESSIILDEQGAENLLGAGDMLVKPAGAQPQRVHGVRALRSDIEQILRERTGREPRNLAA